MRAGLAAAAAGVVLVLSAGCVPTRGNRPSPKADVQLNRLDITQSQSPAKPRVRPVGHLVVRNRTTVNELYLQLWGLPTLPGPLASQACPPDYGIRYHLVFSAGANVILTADANPSGCQEIRLADGAVLRASSATGAGRAFWDLMAKTLHRPLSRLQDETAHAGH